MKLLISLVALVLALAPLTCEAGVFYPNSEPEEFRTELDIPLYDAPFNYENGGPTFPSMRQSLALSTGFYENTHRWIGGNRSSSELGWRRWAIVGVDFLTTWTPLGSSWLHEEWHRAVLSRAQISSYNDVNKFPFFRSLISVSHVRDEDLMRLKREAPADQVRLSAAGMEAQTAQNLLIERHHFFSKSRTYDQVLLWMNHLNKTFYLSTCASKEADDETNRQNQSDGPNISKRDFTGLDCTAWVYDLFRPDEPYSARGTHPSGVGLKRYISFSQLTGREQNYLKRQAWFSLFNFADPFLLGRNEFSGKIFGQEMHWNANLAHTLTSFGSTIDARFFLRFAEENFLFTLHNGFGLTYFPGLSAEWIDHNLGEGFSVTNRLTLWPQPWHQRVESRGRQLLLNVISEISFHWTPDTSMYVGLDGKTHGWVAGNPYLANDLTVFMGYRTSLF